MDQGGKTSCNRTVEGGVQFPSRSTTSASLLGMDSTSIPELEEAIARLWNVRMADSEYLRLLVESMPRRLAEVVERDGNCTK